MFDPRLEYKTPEEIHEFQEQRLQEVLTYVSNNSPFYQNFFAENKVNIKNIKRLQDLSNLPLTTKDDLQTHNDDFLCVDRSKVIDYITTSGTLGEPVTFAATESDLNRLAYNEFISFRCANGNEKDIYQLMVTMDRRFMAGLAYFLGIRKLGAGIVRVGPGNPELQFDTIKRIKPTTLVTVPSFLLKLIEYAESNDIDFKSSSVKSAVCIGEPIRNNDFSLNVLGKKIVSKWNIKLFSTYASTEMGASFSECHCGNGGHLHPDLLITEFLDENDQPVLPGVPGEVTITTLGVEGMPLVRFKTGDICNHYIEPCECGRNSIRLGAIIGRKKQMIKFKGTTLYPTSLYDILNDIKGVENYVVEVSSNNINTDNVKIHVGCNNPDKVFEKSIKDHFRAKLRVAPEIEFSNATIIEKLRFPNGNRKPIVFIDNRTKKTDD